VKELIEEGRVKPIIDRCFPMDKTAEAIEYYGERHTRGKVVVNVQ
jgi:NADPH:quinone reductase-like Zn-dependent oxidoreductase